MKRIVFFSCLYFMVAECPAQSDSFADIMTGYKFDNTLPYNKKLARNWYTSTIIKPFDMPPRVTGSIQFGNPASTIPVNRDLVTINSTTAYGAMTRPESKRFNYQVLTFYKKEPLRFESFDWEELSKNAMRLYRLSIKITRYSVRVKPF